MKFLRNLFRQKTVAKFPNESEGEQKKESKIDLEEGANGGIAESSTEQS